VHLFSRDLRRRSEASMPATNPPAQPSVEKQDGGTVTISIQYWDAQTGISVSFSITA